MAKKKVPELRFKGFEGEWEEKELGAVASFAKGSGYSKYDLLDAGMPIILYGMLYTNYQTVISNVDTCALIKKGSKISSGNEVVVPASGETAEDIARASAVKKPNVILGGDLNIISPNAGLDSIFLALSVSNGRTKNELSRKAQGKTIVHLHNSDLVDVLLSVPKNAEQTKIGAFFLNLDSLIALYQRKHDNLLTVKKAMIEKMFPKECADVPELRFKGFTGKWIKCQLGDVCESIDYGLNAAALEYDGANKYIRITDIDEQSRKFNSDDLTTPDTDLCSAEKYRLMENDVLFARTGASVGKTYLYTKHDGVVYFAGFLIRARIKKDVNGGFVFLNTLTQRYFNFVKITSQRSGQPGINALEYGDYYFMLPQRSEQDRIADFFQRLDSLISLHARELDKLRNIKKACLKKMFV